MLDNTQQIKNTIENFIFTSCHRLTVTSSSVYSLALRIRRICSKDHEAEEQFEMLTEKLRRREYGEKVIRVGIVNVKEVKREVLRRVERTEGGEREIEVLVHSFLSYHSFFLAISQLFQFFGLL